MAQEVSTLQTNNSAGGFFGSLFTGLAGLVTTAAPIAANVYQLKLQADVLKNQSAQQLAQAQLTAAQLAAAAKTPAAGVSPTAAAVPAWARYAALAAGVVIVLLLVLRFRRR